MFGLRGRAFRFGNVVGPNQTHGVGFDFVRKLLADPTRLEILGDGSQSKSYVHVDDVLAAVLLAGETGHEPFKVFNVATGDYITVTEIAALAVEFLGLDPGTVELDYTGGDRGWKGDVPVVRIATDRIRALGWPNRCSSREALRPRCARCSTTHAPGGSGDRGSTRAVAVFLDRDGVLNRAEVREVGPTPVDGRRRRDAPGRRRGLPRLPDAGWLLLRRHQPARHRPRARSTRAEVDAINDVIVAWTFPSPRSWCARTTTSTRARAASRRRGCSSTPPPAGTSTCAAAHGRRPLARRRGRAAGR